MPPTFQKLQFDPLAVFSGFSPDIDGRYNKSLCNDQNPYHNHYCINVTTLLIARKNLANYWHPYH